MLSICAGVSPGGLILFFVFSYSLVYQCLHLNKCVPVFFCFLNRAISNEFSKRLYNSFNSLSLIACRIAPTSSTNFPIFTNPFKFFQILTFRFFCVLGRINQRHIVCCCRPSFTRCRGRVSYFVISVSGNLKIKIVNRCFHNKMFTFREPARSVFVIL